MRRELSNPYEIMTKVGDVSRARFLWFPKGVPGASAAE
jgi:hypothetical protein